MNKITLLFITLSMALFPTMALACGPNISGWVLIGVPLLHLLPFIIGHYIVGEGKRLWFFYVSIAYYFSLYAITSGFSLIQSDGNFLTALLLPYLLIIVALIKRKERTVLS